MKLAGRGWKAVVAVLVGLAVPAAFGATPAFATDVQHGISFTKGCSSPVNIGSPYSCSFSIRDDVDEAQDTLTINSLVDVVHSAGGDVSSGELFSSLKLDNGGTSATCSGGSITGTGTVADPWTNATLCTLPFGSRINVQSTSHYTVQAADFALPGHNLTDSASLGWHDLCDDPAHTGDTNCNPNPPNVGAASQAVVNQIPSKTTTTIHNASHGPVTTVEVGTTVHDFVNVVNNGTNVLLQPPSGNVSIDWFTNGTCTGTPAANSGSVGPLDGSGNFDATGFTQTPNTAGHFAFLAHYLGDATYLPSDGPCEPLTVVDANIQITPLTAANQVGTDHVLTGHVNVNDGSGFVNAPDGTLITFAILSGPGAFDGPNNCTTSGGTGSCTVMIKSAVTGQTVVRDSTTVTVGGLSLTRSSGDGKAGDSADASKNWVNAKITIAPDATNEVGHSHTFTVTLSKDTGTGFVAAAGEHVDFNLADSNGAVHTAPTGTCTGAGPNTDVNGQCTIIFTSNTAGQVTGTASSTLSVSGVSISVSTNGVAPNSGPAVKTFVDANIQITPATATNPVNTNHVLTGHVNINNGSGAGFVNAPDGTLITFSILSGPGGFVGGINHCTTSGGTGSCTVTITSAVSGTTVIRDTTTVTVGGVPLTRTSGDGKAGDSADAQKAWVAAAITIAPSATNEVGHSHTFTVTLTKDTGTGVFVPAAGEHVDVTLTDSNGAVHSAPTGTCTNAGANTDVNGQCTITFTSNSAGKVTGNATSTLNINTAMVTVSTNGVAPNSGPAVKTFVDANIQITPANATNPTGTNHVLTGHVNINDGSGGGFVNAPDGTVITFSIISGPGSFVGLDHCTTTGGTGSCTATITSSTTGTTVIRDTTTISVGGVSLTRTSGDGKAGDSADANKVWAAAKIAIAPTATNEVGHSHTFTVTLQKDAGSGFVPAAGEHVDVTLTDSNGAVHSAPTGTCTNAGANTDVNGQCTITFTSNSAGQVTGTATSTLSINGAVVTVSTNGIGSNSGPAVKTFVDANIQITPATAINPVGTNHVLTGHVNINDGSGVGFVNAPDGTQITFTIQSGPGSFTTANPCTTSGGTGSCTITLTSATTGTTVVRASTTVSVGGVSLTRTSGDGKAGDSADASKNWADDVVATHVRDANGNDITNQTVNTGTVVHDEATVTKAAGTPASVPDPTGTVSFTLFDNGTCNGNVVATDANEPLVAGLATSSTFNTPTAGTFSYLAHYNGDANYPAHNGPCEPFTVQTPGTNNLTPGFWKNHQAATQALLPLTLGNHVVSTFAEAKVILSGMGCGSVGALNCMAGMLLAAELNLAQGGVTCIAPVVAQANALLIAHNYTGFGTYPLNATDQALAMSLHDKLSAYNIDGIPTC